MHFDNWIVTGPTLSCKRLRAWSQSGLVTHTIHNFEENYEKWMNNTMEEIRMNEYLKRKEESITSYSIRLYKNRKNYGLTFQECGDLLNEVSGED